MFFRHQKPKVYTFSERVSRLPGAGFQVSSRSDGSTRVTRQGCAADIAEGDDGRIVIRHTGVLLGEEIGELVDIGFQKIFQSSGGRRAAARAEHLKAIHAFTEDLRETLGLTSYYNQGLGTTNEHHLYDRVEHRDAGVPDRPWKK